MQSISAVKILSHNDVGLTNSHQAGFLIPKTLIKSGLFPMLSTKEQNPRIRIKIVEPESGYEFYLNYIYYNNKFHGGTRNEYRLTGLSSFIREKGLKAGDGINLTLVDNRYYELRIIYAERKPKVLTQQSWQLIYGGSHE